MPARVSEAFVLRTYPFQEGDLIVGFFTRDQGRLRGVAKRARRPKSQFGSALERMSEVRISYHQKETLELVRIDAADLVQSQFGLAGCYEAGVALDFIAEVSDHLLPPAEPNERFYRLLAAVLADLRASRESGVWRVATYFTYWAVRLSGFLPALRVSEESQALASAMAKAPISEFAGFNWTRDTAADLRRQLTRELESHLDRRLASLPLMEAL